MVKNKQGRGIQRLRGKRITKGLEGKSRSEIEPAVRILPYRNADLRENIVSYITKEYNTPNDQVDLTSIRSRRRGKSVGQSLDQVSSSRQQEIVRKDLSLKTIWLCCYHRLTETRITDRDRVKAEDAIVFFERFSDFAGIHPLSASGEDYTQLFVTNNVDEETSFQYLDLLNWVLSLAVSYRYIKSNPLKEQIAVLRDHLNRRQLEVRDALAKRVFNNIEFKKLLEHITRRNVSGDYVSLPAYVTDDAAVYASIRLFTGMTGGEVCALTWEDFRRIFSAKAELPYYQFMVSKQLNNGDKDQPYDATIKDRVRLVAIPIQLSEMLLQRKAYLERVSPELTGLDKRIVSSLPDDGESKLINTGRTLSRMNKVLRNWIRDAIGVTMEVILPDDEGGNLTDLYQLHGDIVRSNFRSCALHRAMLKDGETAYILATAAQSTYARYYADFSNPFIQAGICKKLGRWAGTFLRKVDEYYSTILPDDFFEVETVTTTLRRFTRHTFSITAADGYDFVIY